MPSSEYTSATGGALKLKSKTGTGVTKPKKKKKPTPKPADEASTEDTKPISTPDSSQRQTSRDRAEAETEQSKHQDLESRQDVERTLSPGLEKEVADARREDGGGKTEAERRYEERKRKRLDERLRREGVKTHKERVEELNRYLSRLSEHHDMPRIGPG
jgi:protein FAM32A